VRVVRLIPALSVLVALALPGAAAAQEDFQQIFNDYKGDGTIDGCYRPDQLHNAGQGIPPDIQQYAPGFGDALTTAGAQCGSDTPAPTGPVGTDEEEVPPTVVSAGTPGPGAPQIEKTKAVPEPPAPKVAAEAVPTELAAPNLATAAVASETPGALVALLVAAGIAVLLSLAWTVAWFMGWSPERLTKPLFATFESVWDRLSPGR